MLNELEELNEYFIKLDWEFSFTLKNNKIIHKYTKNNDNIIINFNKLDSINISIPIIIGDYRVNYNTNFESFYMAIEYIYNHLDYYEKNYCDLNNTNLYRDSNNTNSNNTNNSNEYGIVIEKKI